MLFNTKHWILEFVCLSLNFNVAAQGDAKIGKLKTMSCMGCHGPTGNSFVPNFPALSGQPARYIAKQIQDFTDALLGHDAPTIPVITMEHTSNTYVQGDNGWSKLVKSYKSLEAEIKNN